MPPAALLHERHAHLVAWNLDRLHRHSLLNNPLRQRLRFRRMKIAMVLLVLVLSFGVTAALAATFPDPVGVCRSVNSVSPANRSIDAPWPVHGSSLRTP